MATHHETACVRNKRKTRVRSGIPRCLIVAVLPLAGCVIGNSVEPSYVRSTTIGQELVDLQAAKDKGAITAEEYEELKARIKEMAKMELDLDFEGEDRDD